VDGGEALRTDVKSTVPPPGSKKPDPLVGTVIAGKFKVHSLVASGGMGKVYRAEQAPLGRPVALKVLHMDPARADDTDQAQFKKRFLREANILAQLQHPNIVTVFDYGAIEGESERYFMAMEFLSGETLSQRIAERVRIEAPEVIRIALQLARGLTEAHAHNIVHRDLKPSNLMLIAGRGGEEVVKIVDFGIVKIVGEQSQETVTQEGAFIGSPSYMAPEQIETGGKMDTRTDIYALGVILYQCLTGTVPFEAGSSIQMLMAHLNKTPQPMRERAPQADIPDWLDELVMSCMEKAADRRPQTMDGIARVLAEADAAMRSGRNLASITGMSMRLALHASPDTLVSPSGQSLVAAPSARKTHSITTQGTAASVAPEAPITDGTRISAGGTKPTRSRLVLLAAAGGAALLALGGLVVVLSRAQGSPPVQAASPPSPPAVSVGPLADDVLPTADPIPSLVVPPVAASAVPDSGAVGGGRRGPPRSAPTTTATQKPDLDIRLNR
jgi:serine/threonine-protein kinase